MGISINFNVLALHTVEYNNRYSGESKLFKGDISLLR